MKRLAHYSQYFLRNPQFIEQLIDLSSIGSDDTVLDIGAGSGTITAELAKICREVVSIEFEPRMAGKLRDNVARYSNVQVVEGDFLALELPKGRYKIFANIPFHLSSPIVRRLAEAEYQPADAYLIVQKQFANKLLPKHEGFTGQLGMQIGPIFAVRILKRLRRTDYWPHPNVDTVLIELHRREKPLISREAMVEYRLFVEQCFSTPKIFAKTRKQAAGIPLDMKPSEMQLADWVRLFQESTK